MEHNYATVGQIRSLPLRICKYPNVTFFFLPMQLRLILGILFLIETLQ